MSEFWPAAIDFVRRQAPQIAKTRDYEFLRVAAHLFAIASTLQVKREDLLEPPSPAGSLQELSRTLANLADDLDAPRLYGHLLNALVTVEAELCLHRKRDEVSLPTSTKLSEIVAGEEYCLSGIVRHWLRPASAMAQKRDSRYRAARKGKPPRPKEHPMDHLNRLAMFWELGGPAPGVAFFRRDHDREIPLVDESGKAVERARPFRVALCSLKGDFHPLFEVDPDRRRFRVLRPEGMANQAALSEALADLLVAARAAEIHLLVLPELTISLPVREEIIAYLKRAGSCFPYGTVPGSFHVWPEDAAPGGGRPVNEALLLDQRGAPLLSHWKKGEFHLERSKARPPWFPGKLPPRLQPKLVEDIAPGSRLEILETTLGRLAILICADAIAPDPDHDYLQTIRRLRPDLVLIISMSPKTKPFEKVTDDLASHWIGSLFVNAHCICSTNEADSPFLALCNLALIETPKAPPTRVRLRYGADEAERFYYRHPKEGKEVWKPVATSRAEAGVSWLAREGRRLGLVLDLGVHWAHDRNRGSKRTVREDVGNA